MNIFLLHKPEVRLLQKSHIWLLFYPGKYKQEQLRDSVRFLVFYHQLSVCLCYQGRNARIYGIFSEIDNRENRRSRGIQTLSVRKMQRSQTFLPYQGQLSPSMLHEGRLPSYSKIRNAQERLRVLFRHFRSILLSRNHLKTYPF